MAIGSHRPEFYNIPSSPDYVETDRDRYLNSVSDADFVTDQLDAQREADAEAHDATVEAESERPSTFLKKYEADLVGRFTETTPLIPAALVPSVTWNDYSEASSEYPPVTAAQAAQRAARAAGFDVTVSGA